jgi:hypothetical protein
VLWKRGHPNGVADPDDRAAARVPEAHVGVGDHGAEGVDRGTDDARVPSIQRDREPWIARGPGHAPIAEVQTKQIAIGVVVRRSPAVKIGPRRRSHRRTTEPAPIPHGAHRDAGDPGDSVGAHSRIEELLRSLILGWIA